LQWPGVLRTKGFFWLATRMEFVGLVQRAGGLVRHEPAGIWWAATPVEQWPTDPEALAELKKDWHPEWGDRRTELVVIGQDMPEREMREALEVCVLADEEYAQGPAGWAKLRDPFPRWARAPADA